MPLYVSVEEYRQAQHGALLEKLDNAALEGYVKRAGAGIEAYCSRTFEPQDGIAEELYTYSFGRALIDNTSGNALLYPVRRYPIRAVSALTWQLMPVGPVQALGANEYALEKNRWGDGELVHVYRDFFRYRDPSVAVCFTLTYDGGFGPVATPAYPDWLREAAIEWTSHLLKKRGSQALVIAGSGIAVDQSALGGHLRAAQDALEPFRRRF